MSAEFSIPLLDVYCETHQDGWPLFVRLVAEDQAAHPPRGLPFTIAKRYWKETDDQGIIRQVWVVRGYFGWLSGYAVDFVLHRSDPQNIACAVGRESKVLFLLMGLLCGVPSVGFILYLLIGQATGWWETPPIKIGEVTGAVVLFLLVGVFTALPLSFVIMRLSRGWLSAKDLDEIGERVRRVLQAKAQGL
jgi:hypothetical protein